MPIKTAVLAAPFTGPAQGAGLTRLCTGLSAPAGMAFDSKGNLYIANWSAGRIDRWSPESGLEPYIQNVDSPSGLARDQKGRLYICTWSDNSLYRLEP